MKIKFANLKNSGISAFSMIFMSIILASVGMRFLVISIKLMKLSSIIGFTISILLLPPAFLFFLTFIFILFGYVEILGNQVHYTILDQKIAYNTYSNISARNINNIEKLGFTPSIYLIDDNKNDIQIKSITDVTGLVKGIANQLRDYGLKKEEINQAEYITTASILWLINEELLILKKALVTSKLFGIRLKKDKIEYYLESTNKKMPLETFTEKRLLEYCETKSDDFFVDNPFLPTLENIIKSLFRKSANTYSSMPSVHLKSIIRKEASNNDFLFNKNGTYSFNQSKIHEFENNQKKVVTFVNSFRAMNEDVYNIIQEHVYKVIKDLNSSD